jgi:hypothetical protein
MIPACSVAQSSLGSAFEGKPVSLWTVLYKLQPWFVKRSYLELYAGYSVQEPERSSWA